MQRVDMQHKDVESLKKSHKSMGIVTPRGKKVRAERRLNKVPGMPNWVPFEWEMGAHNQGNVTKYYHEKHIKIPEDMENRIMKVFNQLSLKEKLTVYAFLRFGYDFADKVMITKKYIDIVIDKFRGLYKSYTT